MRNLFYFGLEPLKERYTYQLSNEWMPLSFKKYKHKMNFVNIEGYYINNNNRINKGVVLDATGRGKWSLNQCQNFLQLIERGLVKDNDIIFLQDFFTMGMDSVWYALDLYGIRIKAYSMLHSQSVDEYDFTYDMRHWIRGYELGLDARMNGIFVGSTIHKEQLRAANFKAPIHVMSLPIHFEKVIQYGTEINKKENTVIFTSRFDKEKNPYFMIEVADYFLSRNKDWNWVVTTSSKEIKSNLVGVPQTLSDYAEDEPRFILKSDLSKREYYNELQKSKIQFNSSLQDYVSWTLLESTIFGNDIVYPNFRCFPEIIEQDRLYKAFDVMDAVNVIENAIKKPRDHYHIPIRSNIGRQAEAFIVANDVDVELNIWHEYELIKKLINEDN